MIGLGGLVPPNELAEDIAFQLVERTNAAAARDEFKGLVRSRAGKAELVRLLRHHSDFPDGTVADTDTLRRDAYDSLLTYYGMVELGCRSGALDPIFSASFGLTAWQFLTFPAIRRYYTVHYPVALPALLVSRLAADRAPGDVDSPGIYAPIFVRFLEIDQAFDRGDREIERFLWLLDSGTLDDGPDGGYDLAALLRILQSPEHLIERLSREEEEREDVDRALHGALGFLRFASEFRGILNLLAFEKPLASAYWFCYAYWFERMNEHLDQFARSIAQLNPGQSVENGISALADLRAVCSPANGVTMQPFVEHAMSSARHRAQVRREDDGDTGGASMGSSA